MKKKSKEPKPILWANLLEQNDEVRDRLRRFVRSGRSLEVLTALSARYPHMTIAIDRVNSVVLTGFVGRLFMQEYRAEHHISDPHAVTKQDYETVYGRVIAWIEDMENG